MSRIRTLVVAVLAFTVTFAVGVSMAGAQPAPDPVDDTGIVPTTLTPPSPSPMISHGSPIWAFVLIAAITAVVAVVITLLAVQRLHRSSQPITA
jgi:hypothetical protein